MDLLYITDSTAGNWAIATDTPDVRTMLKTTKDLWEDEVPPITITELKEESNETDR